jgi:hypothetical protein
LKRKAHYDGKGQYKIAVHPPVEGVIGKPNGWVSVKMEKQDEAGMAKPA